FFSSRRRHTRFSRDWSSDVCSSDLEDDESACEQEYGGAQDVLNAVVGMERNSVEWYAARIQMVRDLDSVRIVGTHLMQGEDVDGHQQQQYEWQGNHAQGKEAVEGGVAWKIVAHDPFGQAIADDRDCAEQRDDHLRAPERH